MSVLMGMLGSSGMGALGTLFVKLTADSTSLVRGMGQAEAAIAGGSARMLKQLTILSMGVTGAMVAIGAVAVREAMKFESSFTGVRKTVNATEEEFAALEKTFRGMAKTLPINVNAINKIAESAGQLGIQTKNLEGFTRVIIDLGNTTNLVGEDAATSMARFANITAMSQKDFDRLGSTIVALGNTSATTEAEIMGMAMRIAGAGSVVGMSEHQIVSFAASLSSVGVEAEAGGTAISQFMIKTAKAVSTGSKELETFASVAGMTSEQFSKAFGEDAAGALLKVMEGLGRMAKEGEDVFTILEELGMDGIRLTDVMLRASGAGDLFARTLKQGATAWEENTALAKEAEQRYKTFESQLQITVNLIRDLFITIGDGLMPAMKELNGELQSLTSSNDSFNASLKANSEAVGNALLFILKAVKMIGSGWMDLLRLTSAGVLNFAQHMVKLYETVINAIKDIFSGIAKIVHDELSFLIKFIPNMTAVNKALLQTFLSGSGLQSVQIEATDLTKTIEKLKLAEEEMWKQLSDSHGAGAEALRLEAEAAIAAKKAAEDLAAANLATAKSYQHWSESSEKVTNNLAGMADQIERVKKLTPTETMDRMGIDPFGNIAGFERGLGGIPGFGDQGTVMGAQLANDLKANEAHMEMLEAMGEDLVKLDEKTNARRLEALAAYNEQAKLLQVAQAQFALSTASTMFDDLAEISAAFAGEQSGIFKAMFAVSKAFAIAEAMVKIQQGIANAASLPFPANLAAMASVVAATASIVSNIQSVKMAVDGKRAAGGSVSAGEMYQVGERGTELFSPSQNGTIIPHERVGGAVRVVVNNYTDVRPEVMERNENGERVIEVVLRRVKTELGSEIRDGRGTVTKALESSFGLRRGRA